MVDRKFQYKKAQIENFLKNEFERKFGSTAKVSVRKRQKFMEEMSKKIGEKFGKDVLCLFDFTKQGFVTLISPAHIESTDKGKLYQSFTHPQVAYTSHCVDRFSQRTQTTENCIITLDAYLDDALLTFGQHDGYLVCPVGVFAYEIEGERLIIKTYINYEILSKEQVERFYGADSNWIPVGPSDGMDSDFILSDESPHPDKEPQN